MQSYATIQDGGSQAASLLARAALAGTHCLSVGAEARSNSGICCRHHAHELADTLSRKADPWMVAHQLPGL